MTDFNYSTVFFLVDDEVPIRGIRVQYEDGGSNPTIKKTFDSDIKKGDFVLVETGTRWGATICKVLEVDVEVDIDTTDKIGWIFGVADLDELDRLKDMEKQMTERIKEGQKAQKKQALLKSLGGTISSDIKSIAAPLISPEKSE